MSDVALKLLSLARGGGGGGGATVPTVPTVPRVPAPARGGGGGGVRAVSPLARRTPASDMQRLEMEIQDLQGRYGAAMAGCDAGIYEDCGRARSLEMQLETKERALEKVYQQQESDIARSEDMRQSAMSSRGRGGGRDPRQAYREEGLAAVRRGFIPGGSLGRLGG